MHQRETATTMRSNTTFASNMRQCTTIATVHSNTILRKHAPVYNHSNHAQQYNLKKNMRQCTTIATMRSNTILTNNTHKCTTVEIIHSYTSLTISMHQRTHITTITYMYIHASQNTYIYCNNDAII